MSKPSDLIQGTLDLLILKTISLAPHHGWSPLAKRRSSRSLVTPSKSPGGALYPALHRLEQQAWIAAEWHQTDSGREAKFYTLTEAGRIQLQKELAEWERLSGAVGDSHRPPPGDPCVNPRREIGIARMRLRSLFRRNKVENDLDRELRFHIPKNKPTKTQPAACPPAEARAAALRAPSRA